MGYTKINKPILFKPCGVHDSHKEFAESKSHGHRLEKQ